MKNSPPHIVINKKVTGINIDPEEVAKEIHSLKFNPRKIDGYKKLFQMPFFTFTQVPIFRSESFKFME